MKKQDIPNLVTFFRILLVIPVLLSLQAEHYALAFALFFLAGLSDAVDGFLARRYHWHSRLGAMLDPLADKLLMVSTFLCLAYLGDIPFWLVSVVVIRDVIIIWGGIMYHYLVGSYEFTPSLVSKINTFLQLMLIVALLFNRIYFLFPAQLLLWLMYVIFVTNIMSLIQYVWIWSLRATRNG